MKPLKKPSDSMKQSKRRNGILNKKDDPFLSRKTLGVEYSKDLLERFQKFNMNQSFQNISRIFRNLYGRHSAINYLEQFGFKQQWQISQMNLSKLGGKQSSLFALISFCMILLNYFSLWGLSTSMTFEILNHTWIYSLMLVTCVTDLMLTIPKLMGLALKQKVLAVAKELYCIIFFIWILSDHQKSKLGAVEITIGIFVMTYENIKIFHISSQYRDIVKLFDLFVLLMAVTHIFALFLYSVGKIHPEKNWMLKIDMQDQNWTTYYIYSLYFSCTTLLTVGYGDLSPANNDEILAILVTQIIGIATFGYTVNQIGVVLSSMYQKKERIQKDLNNAENIGDTYQLEPSVVCRMRTELINNKTVSENICAQEQIQLLGKFTDDLRQQIQIQSSMKVIKRSMFIIENWTGKLQSKIACRLVKEIYASEQPLVQTFGKEKLYILDRGKIDILNNTKSGYKVCFQKVLKTLEAKKNTEILIDNVYGYSALISEKSLRLNAVAKETSICYCLSKASFFQILAESEEDLQKFHEIKSKINLMKIPQEIEAPAITNIRQHYRPSIYYINSRHRTKYSKNARCQVLRKNRRISLKLEANVMSIMEVVVKNSKNLKSKEFYNNQQANFVGDNRFNETSSLTHVEETEANNFTMLAFESGREFQRYFRKSNTENIINKMKLHNYMRTPKCSQQ